MEPLEMYFPETFEEACTLLAGEDLKPISGGTAMMTMLKEGVIQQGSLLNLRTLQADHQYIERRDEGIHIGALATLRSIETHPTVEESVPLVAECLAEVASIRVRNAATIGGNLAHADPDLDLPPVLAGLNTELVVQGSSGERTVPFTAFIEGFYQTDLADDELITEVRIPIVPGRTGAYVKHRSLSEADWPCVGVAAFFDDGSPVPTVFINAVSDTPIFRVDGLDEVFADGISDDAIERAGELAESQCDPIGDARGSAWYKQRMANVITKRAIRKARDRRDGRAS